MYGLRNDGAPHHYPSLSEFRCQRNAQNRMALRFSGYLRREHIPQGFHCITTPDGSDILAPGVPSAVNRQSVFQISAWRCLTIG
jgi:hypothetical protein